MFNFFFVVCGFFLFFLSKLFSKAFFKNTIKVSNRMDHGQARCFVGPNQCLDCNGYQQTALVVTGIKVSILNDIWELQHQKFSYSK